MFVKDCEFCGKIFRTKSNKKRFCSKQCAYSFAELKQMENEQLCWRCNNACGGCSWSENFAPVEGWTAYATVIKDSMGEDMRSYRIKACPQFSMRYAK